MKKVKVPVYINDCIVNEIVRHVKGYRGLSSKKSRVRNKKICQVIPDIIEKYMKSLGDFSDVEKDIFRGCWQAKKRIL